MAIQHRVNSDMQEEEQEQDNHIRNPQLIATHLARLQRGHFLVGISIAGTSNSYNSMLVKIDTDKHTMLLDILHPEAAHLKILKYKDFTFNVSYDGINISFKGTVKELIDDDDTQAYLVDFPDKLLYQQRRQTFRSSVSRDTLLPVTLTNPKDNTSCKGTISNVSIGGLRLQLEHAEEYSFDKLSLLSCTFVTTEDVEISCSVEVRNITIDSAHGPTTVGVQFKNLDNQQKRYIQNFSLQMEREMIKRQRS